jgi:hypothetical protein
MKVLQGTDVWRAIAHLNKVRGSRRAIIIASFFGTDANRLLPLKGGDTLVVAASQANVRAGLVNPTALLNYSSDVRIYSAPKLHGKLYAFGSHTVVGSANVSTASATVLDELAVIVPVSTEDVDQILDALEKKILSRSELLALDRIYRPPRGSARRVLGPSRPRTGKPAKSARPIDTARIWYHGPFGEDEISANPLRTSLVSMRRIRAGDWYVMVYVGPSGELLAAPPRHVLRVDPVGGGVKVRFAREVKRASKPAREIEDLVVPGAPPVKYRWQLLSERAPANQIFAAFGMRSQAS